eukprot:6659882-Pyramimonas_sp.AAC.1
MAMFEIADSESDVSDRPMQSTEQVDCTDIADVAVTELNDNVLLSAIDQPMDDPAVVGMECNVERSTLECCCGPRSQIGDSRNFADNSC